MGLDQAIQDWWQATRDLTTLVPVDRVASEIRQTDETLPDDEDEDFFFDDCVVHQITTDSLWRTNSGQGYQSTVILSAYSFEEDDAKRIIDTARLNWDRETFLGSTSKITLCHFGETVTEQDEEESLWVSEVTITMNHTRA